MEDIAHRAIGALVIAGLIIGTIVPIYFITNNMPGNNSSLVDLINMLSRLFIFTPSTNYHFIGEKEIRINDTNTLKLNIKLMNGYIEISQAPVNIIIISIYSTELTANGYRVSFNRQGEALNIVANSSTVKLVVEIPDSIVINGLCLDMINGISKIHVKKIEGPISFVINNGILESELNNIVTNNTFIKMSNGIVKLSLRYSHINLSEIEIRVSNGVFKASIEVPRNTRLKVTPSIANGIVQISLNGKTITKYEDLGYNNSSLRLDCKIAILNGYAKIDFTR